MKALDKVFDTQKCFPGIIGDNFSSSLKKKKISYMKKEENRQERRYQRSYNRYTEENQQNLSSQSE